MIFKMVDRTQMEGPNAYEIDLDSSKHLMLLIVIVCTTFQFLGPKQIPVLTLYHLILYKHHQKHRALTKS